MNKNSKKYQEIDLSHTLNDLDGKSNHKKDKKPITQPNNKSPKIIQWIIKYSGGYVKNNKYANLVILGFIGLSVILTVILLSNTFYKVSEPPEGLRGNIPNTPEYQNPPLPEDLF